MRLDDFDDPGKVAVYQMDGGFGFQGFRQGVKPRTPENRLTTSRFSPPMRLASGRLKISRAVSGINLLVLVP